MVYDAAIIGAGACGLMCGVEAGKLKKNVIVLERNEKPGAKILISGGGRCNYTNLYTSAKNFVSEDPSFASHIFKQWTVHDTIRFFEEQEIIGKEKTLGQLFPVTNKAKDVVSVFTKLLAENEVPLKLNSLVLDIQKTKEGPFEVLYEYLGKTHRLLARSVVFSSGGLPVHKLGASDFALRMAKKFSIRVTETAPGLVPLTVTGKDADWFAALSGNSVFAEVSNGKISFQENILFTHWGLSGPAILQISSYIKPGEEISINLLPHHSFAELIAKERNAGGRRTLHQLLQDHFTKRFCEALGKFLPVDLKIASLGKKDAKRAAEVLHSFKVKPAGTKGYDKAEVMIGGVCTKELNPKTLMSHRQPGLYFGGECVDMTGWLGGYNFQWAWASGVAIARAL